MDFSQIFFTLIGLSLPILIIAIWVKRKRQMRNLRSQLESVDAMNSPMIGDQAELAAAEAQLNVPALELRRRLLETHALYDRFSTLQGFSDTYMSDLMRELRDKGIECEVYFQETVPAGVADVLVRQGVQELYIRREQIDEADLILRERLGRN